MLVEGRKKRQRGAYCSYVQLDDSMTCEYCIFNQSNPDTHSVERTGAVFHVRSVDLLNWTRRYRPKILAIKALRDQSASRDNTGYSLIQRSSQEYPSYPKLSPERQVQLQNSW